MVTMVAPELPQPTLVLRNGERTLPKLLILGSVVSQGGAIGKPGGDSLRVRDTLLG